MVHCSERGMRYRDRIDIISLILEAANGDNDATMTKIMYKAFLSHGQLKGLLKILTDYDLLRYDFVRHTFKTTEKGLRFLKTYTQMDQMMKAQQI
jgi:predicted transcriptional regulator